jgi:hypothetical protein
MVVIIQIKSDSILFEITVDSRFKAVIFADIEKYSRKKDEKKILFSLGAVFIIAEIQYDSLMDLWKIQPKATDKDLKQTYEYLITIRK